MSTTATNSTDRVLIIGGGISGLCLAQGLKKHGIPFTVFERDESATSRPQGFRLRINGEGLAALEASLPDDLLELFHKSNAIFEQGFAFHDPITGEKKTSQWQQPKHPGTAGEGKTSEWKQPQQPPAAGETKLPQRHQPPTGGNLHRGPSFASDRATLRAVLAANLSEDELRYGMSFKTSRLRPDSSGIEVKFENGEVVSGALMVGADGTYSRIRKSYLWEETELLDTDGRIIYGKTPLTPELEAVFPPEALRTTSLATDTDPHMSLFSEPMRFSPETREFVAANGLEPVDDYLYWAVVARSETFDRARRPEDQVEQLTPEQLRDLLLRVTEHWSPNLRVAFEQQTLGFGAMLKIASMNPKIKPWKPTRATLMGDAIHAMTPAGIGANVALKDAAVLLKSILEHGVSIEAVGVYEEQMREYATHAVTMSFGAGRKMFGQPEVEDMKTIE